MIFDNLRGKCVLLVEDDYLQASDLAEALRSQQSDILGPFSDLESTFRALEKTKVDMAVLDIRLGSEQVHHVYDVADLLVASGIPFIFFTGMDLAEIPARFHAIRCLEKPVDPAAVPVALAITIAEHATRLHVGH